MKLRSFAVPIHDSTGVLEELNRFLATHRVVTIDREFVDDGSNSAWAVLVTFDETGPSEPSGQKGRSNRIDYKEVLSPEDFAIFSKLRELRKDLAAKEGVPAYALFTNEQLAEMVRQRVDSPAALGKLEGVGEARVEKYGEAFLAVLKAAPPRTPGESKD